MSGQMLKHVCVLYFILALWNPAISLAIRPKPRAKLGMFLGQPLGSLTTAQLEKILGPGEEELGGHPKSGRYWKLRNGATLSTDAFYPKGSSLVIYNIWLQGKGTISSGFTPSEAKRLGFLSLLHWDASLRDVEHLLRKAVESCKGVRLVTASSVIRLTLPARAAYNLDAVEMDFDFSAGALSRIRWVVDVPEPGVRKGALAVVGHRWQGVCNALQLVSMLVAA